ncbi:MAG: SNF2-related protein [Methylobacter sp.]|nr:SNF2-related protein [Methylobacter sp.]
MDLIRYLPAEIDQIQSRGSAASKAGSLAALHEKRNETLSQFFTPDWLVRFIWQALLPAFDSDDGRYRLLDNSIGSAGMFRYADPKRFHLCGLDVDGELVETVCEILDGNGYMFDLVHSGMESVELVKFSASLINPPFSIPLSSPFLSSYFGVTHYGKYGPDTSAVSHEYALAQALNHSDIVAAVMPASTLEAVKQSPVMADRLRAVFDLPSSTFKEENVVSVNTVLMVFGRKLQGPAANAPESIRIKTGAIDESSVPPTLFQLSCRSVDELGHSRNPIRVIGIEESKPVITTPATGDNTLILKRAGRWIKLDFFDGATEGRVKNALYRSRLYSNHLHKYPAKTRYAGQFQLNLDVISMQDDPLKALSSVCNVIRKAGGEPVVNRQLIDGIKSIVVENKKMGIPFGRTVSRKGTPEFKATANKMALINRAQKGAAVSKNEAVTAKRIESGFIVQTGRGEFTCDHDTFFALFTPEEAVVDAGYWEEVYPPIKNTFPKEIDRLKAKSSLLGIDQWLTWDYQLEDLCELAFKPNGAICGWQMALGKSRLALSLALLLNGKSLLVLKSRLVPEMANELKSLGVTDYKVIKTLGDTKQLGKINIISYERLRMAIDPRFPKLTLAKFLRKKIKNVLCDEGGLLANYFSQQTRAVWAVGAKRRYILDGTPSPNYPREMQNLAAFVAGQERAYQPFSMAGGFIEQRLFNSAEFQPTGRDEFTRRYVTLEWATNEFLDSHARGAKREVPKIKHAFLQDYRAWVAPMIKRRVQQEPAVSRYVKFPVPTLCDPIEVDWVMDHLLLYVKVAEEFAGWYKKYAKERGEEGKALNLAMILARLEACFKAANVPSAVSGYGRGFQSLTSKEKVCLDLIENEIKKGLRPIVFAKNPVVLRRLSAELAKRNITNLVFTGEETIAKRTEKLNERIRNGNDQVMLASLGVTQDGLNLPMLNSVIFYNRSYKSREEFQAIYRLIRPQQKSEVSCHFLHLKGSIDEYMGQLIKWKTLASEAGLDYGEQGDDEEFIHFDAFVYRFINSIPELKDRLDSLKKLAA